VLIARLTARLRCYVPEPVDETWGRLRHLGIRREQLLTDAGSQVQQMRDLLECAWPAALHTARQRDPRRSARRPRPATRAEPSEATTLTVCTARRTTSPVVSRSSARSINGCGLSAGEERVRTGAVIRILEL
jgi:hypothetical protein